MYLGPPSGIHSHHEMIRVQGAGPQHVHLPATAVFRVQLLGRSTLVLLFLDGLAEAGHMLLDLFQYLGRQLARQRLVQVRQ